MTRVKGARNRDYESRRFALADRLRSRLAVGGRPSFAELAASADVSLATLRHYFGDRAGAVEAVLALHGALGGPHLAKLAEASGAFAVSIADAAAEIAEGFATPIVAELHGLGLTEGLGEPRQGPAYLRHILEPTIAALETRLARHVAAGEMRPVDTRAAALTLLAPLVLAHLHQDGLGGRDDRPLDQAAHREAQVDAFLRAYGAAVLSKR